MTSELDIVALTSWGLMRLGSTGVTPAASNDFARALVATVDAFLNQFGESITYQPLGGLGNLPSGAGEALAGSSAGIFHEFTVGEGLERTITAIIDREQPGELPGAGQGISPITRITVANDAVKGISSSEVDAGGDRVELALRIGETPQLRRITQIVEQDAGMLTLEVR
jgi:hypothetical protein